MDSDSSAVEPLAKRVAYFRRLLAKGIGRTPTALQKLAITNAARLTARAELAACDISCSPEIVTRLDASARRARHDAFAVCHPGQPMDGRADCRRLGATVRPIGGRSLADLIRQKNEQAAR
jgi:hypothetical protein